MRHRQVGRKFGRVKAQRGAFQRSLVRALVLKGAIITTQARAKETRRVVERLITRTAKAESPMSAQRRLVNYYAPDAVKKILALAQKFKGRAGGYTQLIKMAPRPSDSAARAMLRFINSK